MSTEKRRIAILTERIYPLYSGGSEKVMYDYATILSKMSEVTVFTSFNQNNAKQTIENVKFAFISKKSKNNNRVGNHSVIGILFFSLATAWRHRKIQHFDLVILDSIHYFYPIFLLKFLKKRNAKVVTIFHEAWYEYRKSGAVSPPISYFMGICIKRLIRYSDKIVSVSDPTTESLIRNYGVKKDKIVTIALGIDYNKLAYSYPFKKIKDRHYDLVFVGRFAAIKRVCDIVDAVSILTMRGKKLKVALIGDGPQRKLVEQKIKKLGLCEKFQVMGFLNENEKYFTMANSKIFILPSEREGFSVSVLEAMALGCIPIVSRPEFNEVFGVSHFVKNGENGFYYSVRNVNELAQTIIGCIDNLEYSQLISFKAAEASKFYSISEMSRKIYDMLTQLTFQDIT